MASSDRTFKNIDPKCPKHHQMPGVLSSTILDYYHKYGRNRDLEKYLRFRNRSSSGSSIQLSPLSPTNDSRVGKSLENINILESCVDGEKSLQKSKSSESVNKSGRSKPELTKDNQVENTSDTADNQLKLTTKKALKSKKKYNINMDTHIEITLPQQSSHSSHQQVGQQTSFDALSQHDFSQQKIEFETSETQTDRIVFPKTPNRSAEIDTIDIPARPSSVASSAASISNKQRLEWDSMADVGYYKSIDNNNLTNLTEFERRALKKFFNSHGLNFDDEIVVFASKAKLSHSVPELAKQTEKARIREKWDAAFQKILEEKYAKRNGKSKEGKVDTKGLWQSALVKFREKYGTHFNPESDLCITEPTVHSTPILTDSSKGGAIPKVRSVLLDTVSQTENVMYKGRLGHGHVEKACQTSMVITSSKECQVESASDVFSALDQHGITSTDNSKESDKSTDCKGGMVSATSFEFVAPDAYKGQDKENIPPRKKEIIFQPRAIEDRENENKENVPPHQLNDDEIVQKFQLSTPQNTTTATTADSSRTDEVFGVISTLENDLAKGVEVLYSLASARDLNDEKKKRIVLKIIKRITTAKYKDSTASSESIVSSPGYESEKSKSIVSGNLHSQRPNISGVNTLSSTSTAHSHRELSASSAKVQQPVKQDDDSKESSIKEWLKPITNSEVEHERNKSKGKNVIQKLPETESERRLRKNSIHSDVSQCDPKILKFVEQQRQSQFEWIDREICHLVNLKEFLQKKRETDIMSDVMSLAMNRRGTDSSLGTDKSKESGVIYENVTVDPKSTEHSYADVHRNSKEGVALRSNSNPSVVKQTRKESQHQSSEKDEKSNASSSLEWNSHINMQQFVRNRTKLQTPNDDIVSYAQTKEREFLGKYECIRSRPIYTQPYSSDRSDHYSEPHDTNRKSSLKKDTNHAYTSVTGSDGFLSSDSVSIPVANSNSTSNDTTYDTRASVAIQTTSSLARTAPIFRVKSDSCNCGSTNCNCVHTRRPTVRVKYQTNDKQLQVIPKAICYDINFAEKKAMNVDANIKTDNRKKPNSYYRHHTESSSTSSKDSKKKSEPNFVGTFGGCAKLSLQEHLKSARPDFVSQADERRKCVIELHNLREKRNEQRNRLFLLSSNQSLRSHIKTLNPPPIASKRIFTTKALKQQTRNRYNKLPEIVSKEENERQNRIKRSNRIVRDMFNKNLQKRVLKGQTDLSNSVFVAAI